MLSLCFYYQKVRKSRQHGFRDKLRMFGPLIIEEGPSLSTTAGRAVAQLMLHYIIVLMVIRVIIVIS